MITIISQTGFFFTMVALPWLVLYTTKNDPIIMTTVLVANSLPHAFFILFGGAIADRTSPVKILIVTRSLLIILILSLATQVYFQYVPLWLIYIYAFALGSFGSLMIPANQSLMPSIVNPSQLGLANGFIMGSMQLAQFIGPMCAGWLIWFVRHLQGTPHDLINYSSIALAFAVEGLAISIALILTFSLRMNIQRNHVIQKGLLKMVAKGFIFCWLDQGIRFVLIYLAFITLLMHGPMIALLPLFTKVQLGLTEGAYGSLYAMIGLGTIIGAGLAVCISNIDQLGPVVLCCDFVSGLCLSLLGHTTSGITASILLLIMGISGGIIMVAGTTWFQKRTPLTYMGRVMSILMFVIIGLTPLSTSVAGYMIHVTSITYVMQVAGGLLLLLAGVGLLIPKVRNMGNLPKINPVKLEVLNAA